VAGAMTGSANCTPAVLGPLIVTAELAAPDQAWFDQLRRAHYPAERNQVPAHLTIFHALPPSAEREVRTALSRAAAEPAPRASVDGLMDLGGGVAFRIVSPELDRMREDLADSFRGLLVQDAGGWRPHITIQNKVAVREARALLVRLRAAFQPRPLAMRGLALDRHAGGPWERIAVYPFRG